MEEYIITEAKNGFKTLSVRNTESKRETKLHSSFDPLKEAERNTDIFNKGRSSIIIVSGVALGYHLQLLKKKYPDTKLVAVEKEKKVIDICRTIFPDSLSGIEIISSPDDIEKIFGAMDLAGFKGVSNFIHKPSCQLNPKFYEDINSNIKIFISSKISDLLTRFEFEEKWIENIFKNLRHLENSHNVSRLFGKFHGYPGIIVSTGPSLKYNIQELKENRNNAIIVAVDTSLKVLDKHGIEPHFVITLDAQKYSYKHFTGIKPRNTILIADIVSCPAILNNYNGIKIISTTSKYFQDTKGNTVRETTPLIDWIEKYTEPFGDIQSGGSVATSAFDLLLNMGCDPIILAGQDLAYTGREIHCSGTYHNDDWVPGITRLKNLESINQNIIRKRKIKYVKRYGNNSHVISDFIFDLYRSWFEDSSNRVSVSVINSTGNGAKINNTEEMSITEAVRKNINRNDSAEIIDRLLPVNYHNDISGIKKGMNKGYKIIRKIIDLTVSDNPDDIDIEKLNDLFNDDEANLLLNPFMRKSRFYISRHSFDDEKTKDIMYNDIQVTARKLSVIFEKSGLVQ
jgi:hypothetical protein